eukprot:358378-Chlamydomonas_euryale.AAC.1
MAAYQSSDQKRVGGGGKRKGVSVHGCLSIFGPEKSGGGGKRKGVSVHGCLSIFRPEKSGGEVREKVCLFMAVYQSSDQKSVGGGGKRKGVSVHGCLSIFRNLHGVRHVEGECR